MDVSVRTITGKLDSCYFHELSTNFTNCLGTDRDDLTSDSLKLERKHLDFRAPKTLARVPDHSVKIEQSPAQTQAPQIPRRTAMPVRTNSRNHITKLRRGYLTRHHASLHTEAAQEAALLSALRTGSAVRIKSATALGGPRQPRRSPRYSLSLCGLDQSKGATSRSSTPSSSCLSSVP